MPYSLGFLGAGNMAEAIARAAIARGVLTPAQMSAADPAPARREVFHKLGIAIAADNAQVIRQSEQVLIAVKPQVMAQAAADLAAHGRPGQIVISIMAGVTSDKLRRTIAECGGRVARIVRVMPNTPMLVGQGMAAVSRGAEARPGDEALAMKLFSAGGKAIAVDEPMLDAVTAVSGSGPAYVFYLAEAMERAARELGLGEHAPLLVRQTILGAAQLLCNEAAGAPEPPAELRRKVTSPGGTTEAAITYLAGNTTAEVIVNAIKAAEVRSKELGV